MSVSGAWFLILISVTKDERMSFIARNIISLPLSLLYLLPQSNITVFKIQHQCWLSHSYSSTVSLDFAYEQH